MANGGVKLALAVAPRRYTNESPFYRNVNSQLRELGLLDPSKDDEKWLYNKLKSRWQGYMAVLAAVVR